MPTPPMQKRRLVSGPAACRVCAAASARWLFRKKQKDFFQCRHCSLVWFEPPPTPKDLQQHYRDRSLRGNYMLGKSIERITNDQDVLAFTLCFHSSRAKGRKARIFDIGCLFGQFLDLAAAQGMEVWGLELQPDAARVAAQRHANRIFCSSVEEFDERAASLSGQMDMVVASGVLEHTLKPETLFALASRLLKPGGFLILQTPNHASWLRWFLGRYWPCYAVPEHTYYFSPACIRKLGEKYDFTRARFKAHLKTLRIGYVLNQLEFFGQEIAFLLRPLAECLPKAILSLRLPFYGGEMLVCLQKANKVKTFSVTKKRKK